MAAAAAQQHSTARLAGGRDAGHCEALLISVNLLAVSEVKAVYMCMR